MGFQEEKNVWDEAYCRGGNILFYPHEEIIRFINKYVRKRVDVSNFHDIIELSEQQWENFASLDLGCGIGRHVKFLDEFGLNPYGIDLSDTAIAMGKSWFSSIGKQELSNRLSVASVTALPFEDNFFNICVSHGTLDSMPRSTAEKGMQEVYRVLKKNGLMYFDVIMDSQKKFEDEIVQSGYEKGTVQSYFTVERIKELIGNRAEILEFKIITWGNETGNQINRRAHLVIRKLY